MENSPSNDNPVTGNDGANPIHLDNINLSQHQADCEREFRAAMQEAGIDHPPSEIIADGQFHSFTSAYKIKANNNCRYVFHGSHGYFCDWSKGIEGSWSILSSSNRTFTAAEKSNIQKTIEETNRQIKEEEQLRHEQKAQDAQRIWNSLSDMGSSKYLERKQVKPYGVRFCADKGYIAIPLRDVNGKIWNLQRIFDKPLEELDTDRVFMKGARKRGCFFTIGKIEEGEQFFVGEGFCSCASIHMATGKAVVVAFDCYNLTPVVESLKTQYPNTSTVICGDDDCYKDPNKNPGKENAEKAANMFGCTFVLPQFKDLTTKPTDINDLHFLEGLEEVRKQLEDVKPEDNWPEPLPIRGELLPVDPLPLDIIPELLQPWLKDISFRMKCPLEHIAIPTLIMISSIIGAGCGIRPKQKDDWLVTPNLWGGVVSGPGTLKSPSLAAALKPLNCLERKAQEQYKFEKEEYDLSVIAKALLKEGGVSKIKQNIKARAKEMPATSSFVGDNENQPVGYTVDEIISEIKISIKEDEQKPTLKRYKTNDASVESMTVLLEENHRGILLVADELISLLMKWEKPGHETDKSFYLQTWNGYGPYNTDRIGRGITYCKNMCVALFGGIQPGKLVAYIRKAISGLENDGLIQRFQLLVYPDISSSWEYVDEFPDLKAQELVFKLIETLAYINFCEIGAIQVEKDSTPFFHFSEGAQDLFCEWQTELETKKLKDPDENPIILEHLSKYRSLMPSLALIFHVIDIIAEKAAGPVSLKAAAQAAEWCDYLELHARRIYDMATNISIIAASNLSKKLKAHKLKDVFTVRDVYRKDWILLKEKDIAQLACDELVDLDWLREIVTPAAFGQKGKIEYKINPKIWK